MTEGEDAKLAKVAALDISEASPSTIIAALDGPPPHRVAAGRRG